MFNLLFLHVGLMFTAVAMHVGPQFLAVVAARSGQLAAVPAIARVWERCVMIVTAAFGLGALFGIASALAIGYDLLARWLVIAYVLFIAPGMWSNFVTVPHLRRLAGLVEAAPAGALVALAGGGPGAMQAAAARPAAIAEIAKLAGWRLALVVGVDALFIAALVYDMVAKPIP